MKYPALFDESGPPWYMTMIRICLFMHDNPTDPGID